jgi:uncharacterized protein
MRALLDVNVLIALLDRDHLHHARARDWFRAQADAGWASCPITENGCIRVMSQPAYPNPLPASAVIERLSAAAGGPLHEFWADDCSLLDPQIARADRIHGPKQVTDMYLLALAVKHDGRFATFDTALSLSPIQGATEHHVVVL